MKKIVHPCNVPDYDGKKHPMFCKIEFTDGKLSISGVIGPKSNGNSYGSFGQIDMEFDHKNKEDNDTRCSEPIKASQLDFSEGWSRKSWFEFLDVWKHWHLNDINSACRHQEKLGWTYESNRGDWTEYEGRNIEHTKEILEKLSHSIPETIYNDGEYGHKYMLGKDNKTLLYWNEYAGHKCPECGYSIGSSWLFREVPHDVIYFLFSLPDTDKTPAWV